jgi:hypothetical protein
MRDEMHTTLVAALHREEGEILTELRASIPFRRLEEIRRLLALYDQQPPIGSSLDAMLADPRAGRPVLPHPGAIALHTERATA